MNCPVCERPITDMSCVCGYDETADFVRHRTVSLLGAQDIFNRRVLERMAMLESEIERLKSEPKAAAIGYPPKSIAPSGKAKAASTEAAKKGASAPLQTSDESTVKETVFFGRYEHGNGVEPIEWIVLKKLNGYAMLISKYAIDCYKYNESMFVRDWSASYLRKWLNSDFLNAAFTDSERKRIPFTKIKIGENSINDNVWILSADEAELLLGNREERMCKATEYAKSRGAYVNSEGASWWWLRDRASNGKISIVDANGEMSKAGPLFPVSSGAYPTSTMGTVRPVLYMKL